jgi:tetratricopeptide (TPR) repeat protein
VTRILVVWAALLLGVARMATAQAPADARILVMPFENTGHEGRVLWLGEASAVLVADGLTARGQNAIVRQERQRAFERLQVPPSAVLTDATVIRIGQLLGAAQVILGTFLVDGDNLTVHARSIALEAGRVQADATASGPLADLFAIYERVLTSLTPAAPATGTTTYPPVAAFEAYIKGLLAAKMETAVNFFDTALKLHPSYDRVRFALWDLYTSAGEHQRAREALRGVPPESEWARRAAFFIALSDVSVKRYDEAFTSLRALADKQATATVMNNLGAILLKRGSTTPQTGMPTYYLTRAVELDPDDPDYSFNLGYAYWEARDPQAAAYWLRETVRRNPSDGDAHFVLGTALLASGSAAEGARELELARRLSARYEAAQKRPGGDEVPKGLERLKDEPDPRRTRLINASLTGSVQRDQQEVARFYYDHASRLYQQGNDDREALAEAGRALYLSPYMADAHILIGRVHLRNGRVREAIDAFKLALWSSETAAGHAALAEAYRQANDRNGARTEAERALALDPGSVEARRVLGMVQSR